MRFLVILALLMICSCSDEIGCFGDSGPSIEMSSKSIELGFFQFILHVDDVDGDLAFAEITFDENYFDNINYTFGKERILVSGNAKKIGESEMEIYLATTSDDYCTNDGISYLNVTVSE